MTKFDYAVFIGRFQPFHKGHYHVVQKALAISDKVIIVIGSDNEPRSARNPFTTDERIDIIMSAFDQNKRDLARIEFIHQENYTYNEDKWVASIQGAVRQIVHAKWKAGPTKIGLIGYRRDASSYYLKLFPTWDTIPYIPTCAWQSTDIRQQFFGNWDRTTALPGWAISDFHHDTIIHMFNQDELSPVYKEWAFVEGYKKQWENSPYPVTFNTVDALVIQSGHILVVKRGAQPGEGQLALPGGFVNHMETLDEAVLRELYEETRIDVPKPVLKGSVVARRVFDSPWRSQRGRTITTCYHIRLRDEAKLPKIKGGDDAAKAYWMPLDEFIRSRDRFFEDHYDLVTSMLGL